jgi:S-adenosylmethionine decarboxylase
MRKDGSGGRYEVLPKNTPDSIHIIADFSGCNVDLLRFGASGEIILAQAVSASGLNCVLISHHLFQPDGYTAAALLTESHITLHTWPEHASVQIDIFTCGEHEKARTAYAKLKDLFRPERVAEKILFRNLTSIVPE